MKKMLYLLTCLTIVYLCNGQEFLNENNNLVAQAPNLNEINLVSASEIDSIDPLPFKNEEDTILSTSAILPQETINEQKDEELLQKPVSFYKTPRLTLIIVIDQFAHNELQKFYPFLKGGIKFMCDNGIRYTNAFYPHGMPETGVGHTGLATGTLPQDHGIIGNLWNDPQGKVVVCDDDNSPDAAVFSPTGVYPTGKSAKNIMVDTLADQLMMNSNPFNRNNSIALAIKSRSSIAMAGRLGKAIWFDADSGNFTSSKVYFKELPHWIKDFNKETALDTLTSFTWNSLYPENDQVYNFPFAREYSWTEPKKTMVNVSTPIDTTKKLPYELFSKTPAGNQLLLNLAERCIAEYLPQSDHLVMWVSLSSFDLIGHVYGPYSFELIDMLYQVDKQLQTFIDHIYQTIKPEETLLVLTADHGVFPILELLNDNGFTLAKRTNVTRLVEELNQIISEKYGVDNIIINFKMPQFYLDLKKLHALDLLMQDEIINTLKNLLRQQPSIREVWTFDELIQLPVPFADVRNYLKSQLYRGRSGQLICLVHPYNFLDDYTSGTAHGTPYDYDTHVPLMLYQKGKLENKTITKTVYMQQLTATIAQLLNTQRPSACTFDILPGLNPELFTLPLLSTSLTFTGTNNTYAIA